MVRHWPLTITERTPSVTTLFGEKKTRQVLCNHTPFLVATLFFGEASRLNYLAVVPGVSDLSIIFNPGSVLLSG